MYLFVQSLNNNGVSSFTINSDRPIVSYDYRHPFPVTIEFEFVQDFNLFDSLIDHDFLKSVEVPQEPKAQITCSVHQTDIVWRHALIRNILGLVHYALVTAGQSHQKMVDI